MSRPRLSPAQQAIGNLGEMTEKELLDLAKFALDEINERFPAEHTEYMVAKMGSY